MNNSLPKILCKYFDDFFVKMCNIIEVGIKVTFPAAWNARRGSAPCRLALPDVFFIEMGCRIQTA
jgi:hypothetical protein